MTINRRDFLAASLGASTLVTLGGTAPDFLARTAAAATPSSVRDTILVVLQLAGGNDGLNTIVPYADDEYGRARTTLRLPTERLHKIDSHLGFHPEMQGFSRLHKEGLLTIVQGVGYPQQSENHEVSMRAWQTAQPGQTTLQSGWIGRTVERAMRPGDPTVPAAFVGHLRQPFCLRGTKAVIPSLHTLEDWTVETATSDAGSTTSGNDKLLGHVRTASGAAQAASRRVAALARSQSKATGEYPRFQLADTLRTVAQLIRADLGIRIFCTELGGQEPGGFDNHAGQRDNHAQLLRQLSDSVAAFFDDLRHDKLLDRVVLITFSEFGRSVAENGRRGTDHGAAAPMFVAGGKVRGGLVGSHPSLTDLVAGGGMRHHTDFRRVYATLLDGWLGMPSQPVLGQQYEPLPLFRAG